MLGIATIEVIFIAEREAIIIDVGILRNEVVTTVRAVVSNFVGISGRVIHIVIQTIQDGIYLVVESCVYDFPLKKDVLGNSQQLDQEIKINAIGEPFSPKKITEKDCKPKGKSFSYNRIIW